MNALNFPIGVKTFDVNDGAAQISFNPTDVNFVSALYDLFAECAERYETDKDKKFENNTAFFEYVRQRDAEVSDGVDRLFGEGAAAAVFQGHSAMLWRRACLCGRTSFWRSLTQCRKKCLSRSGRPSRVWRST